MAAAGFTACMGGTPAQILQAAEYASFTGSATSADSSLICCRIGIEHSLGLTCDPIDGAFFWHVLLANVLKKLQDWCKLPVSKGTVSVPAKR